MDKVTTRPKDRPAGAVLCQRKVASRLISQSSVSLDVNRRKKRNRTEEARSNGKDVQTNPRPQIQNCLGGRRSVSVEYKCFQAYLQIIRSFRKHPPI